MNSSNKIRRFWIRLKERGIQNAIRHVKKYYIWQIRVWIACDIQRSLPETIKLGHPVGIVIGHDVVIGENVQINQNVTLGERGDGHPLGKPVIEDNVIIYAGSIILGDVTVGKNSTIGANSIVLTDVEPGSTIVGVHS